VSTVVVIGDLQLARAVARLVPTATVVDADDDPDLREPATAVPVIRRRMEEGTTPVAVVLEARPGFSVLAGLSGLPAHRCLVLGSESPFPPASLRSLVEAAGMTFLAQLDALPGVLAGRGTGAPAGERARARAGPVSRDAPPAGPGAEAWPIASIDATASDVIGPALESFSWAAMEPVQVPPLAPATAAGAMLGRVVDARTGPPAEAISGAVPGEPGSTAASDPQLPAYAPSDPLRPMRPRRR